MSAVRVAAALGFAVLAAPVASAQPTPLPPKEQAAVDDAVARAVDFLRREQKPTGIWGTGTQVNDGGYLVGYTALAGLALAEAGVPPSDPALKKAALVVRAACTGPEARPDRTYEVALAILFLDRMADPKDKALIQRLATQLIGGQTQSGGWAYKVPVAAPSEVNQVLGALRKMAAAKPASAFGFRDRPGSLGLCIKMSDDLRPKPVAAQFDPEKARAEAVVGLPARFRGLPVFQDPDKLAWKDPPDKGQEPVGGTTDNSNTHFAVLGLWAARRHDVPVDRSFTLLARRFRSSQDAGGGGWGYSYAKGGSGSSPALTCVALLGLAIGNALAVDKDVGARPEQDQAVLKAFGMLATKVGEPAGTFDGRPSVKDAGGLYHLWALERIAVLYDLPTLGNKDWYRWGLEILVCHQKLDGSWADGGFPGEHPILNTAFALLFLKRANLTPDLSKRLMADTRLIAAKVSETPKPKAEAPPPPPPPPPSVVVKEEPPPPPPVVPKAEPKPQPAVAAGETPPAPPPAEDRPVWPWLLGLAVVLGAAGLGLYFALRPRRDEDDEDAVAEDDDEARPAAAFEVVEDDEDERPRRKKERHDPPTRSKRPRR
jgi:hypothetical protein